MIPPVMRRIRVEIEDWQYDALRAAAKRDRRGISDILREILTPALRPESRDPGAWIRELVGIGNDPDVHGGGHDEYLYSSPDEFA